MKVKKSLAMCRKFWYNSSRVFCADIRVLRGYGDMARRIKKEKERETDRNNLSRAEYERLDRDNKASAKKRLDHLDYLIMSAAEYESLEMVTTVAGLSEFLASEYSIIRKLATDRLLELKVFDCADIREVNYPRLKTGDCKSSG